MAATKLMNVEPKEVIRFEGTLTEVTESEITLTNTSDGEVAWKVKTTAPLMFCVKPNGGTLSSKATINVTIQLQPISGIPMLKKMFMVQSLALSEGVDKSNPWNPIYEGKIERTKLRAELVHIDCNRELVNDVLKMEPSSYIEFTGPFNEVKTCSLTLKNLSDVPVACMCESNYTKQLVLYPSSAVIQKNSSLTVNVILNPLQSIPYGVVLLHVKSLLLSDAVDMNNMWDSANQSKVVKRRLLVKFKSEQLPPSSPQSPSGANLLRTKPRPLNASSNIIFRGNEESVEITLTNPSDDLVAFKVLTTVPTKYGVFPNKGRLSKDESVAIKVKRQIVKVKPSDVKDHKLLVLSRGMHPDLEDKELWSPLDKAAFAETKIDITVE